MQVPTSEVYMTDKTGKKFFVNICATQYADSAVRDLHRKLVEAERNPKLYYFLDIPSLTIVTIPFHKKEAI